MTEQWLSIVEYARSRNVSDMTVRRRIKNGKLKAIMKDGKYFIPVPIHEGQNPTNAMYGGQLDAAAKGPRAPATDDMVIVKSYRTPEHTYASGAPGQGGDARISGGHAASHSYQIPANLRQQVSTRSSGMVDTAALLAFCEASIRKSQESERRLAERFKAKMELLETTVENKDMQIKTLRQQLEDLQLLVQMLEKSRKT